MYVLARNILSPSSCSLCSYICIGLPGPVHPHKVKYSLRSDQIHFLLPCSYTTREGVLVLEDQYIHTSRENAIRECRQSTLGRALTVVKMLEHLSHTFKLNTLIHYIEKVKEKSGGNMSYLADPMSCNPHSWC